MHVFHTHFGHVRLAVGIDAKMQLWLVFFPIIHSFCSKFIRRFICSFTQFQLVPFWHTQTHTEHNTHNHSLKIHFTHLYTHNQSYKNAHTHGRKVVILLSNRCTNTMHLGSAILCSTKHTQKLDNSTVESYKSIF